MEKVMNDALFPADSMVPLSPVVGGQSLAAAEPRLRRADRTQVTMPAMIEATFPKVSPS